MSFKRSDAFYALHNSYSKACQRDVTPELHGAAEQSLYLLPPRCGPDLEPLQIAVARVLVNDAVDLVKLHGAVIHPTPVFRVAIGKGKVATAIVPVRREVVPFVTLGSDAKGPIVNADLMFVEEHVAL